MTRSETAWAKTESAAVLSVHKSASGNAWHVFVGPTLSEFSTATPCLGRVVWHGLFVRAHPLAFDSSTAMAQNMERHAL